MIAGAAPPVAGTHENVHVTVRRVLATVVDGLVFAAVGVGMAYFFGIIAVHDAFGVEVHLGGISWAVWTGPIAIYYILMEGYLGQTVGKMLLGIKVVQEGTGEVPGPGAATIRTLLRVVDGLFSYAEAFVAVVATEKRQLFQIAHVLWDLSPIFIGAASPRGCQQC